uniref:ABC transporter ATP-binding protein n=1 Tax=Microbacterium festucae TaxID=2977531 RepID=UPI0028FC30D9|nr:ABC transporter ATP-binding protein [Microbacterium festucae]
MENVSKKFVIRRDNSIKERVVTFGRRGRLHQEVFESLKDVSVSVAAGSTIGLMGPNGSGKSTLLKVIGGIIDPSEGSVRRRGRFAALLELGAGFHPDLSGRDNVYLNASILGLSREQTDAEFDSIVAFAEIGDFIDTQVKFYSSGMYVRLAFAVAIHTDPDILLVDEVLAVGDEAFQRKCMDKIREFQAEGRTIILVSHSAAQVMEICDQGVVLHEGKVVYSGSAAEATRVHREILEGRRRHNAETAEALESELHPQQSVVAPRVEIVGVELLAADGTALKEVTPGDDIRVSISVRHSHAAAEWNTGISIDTPTGQQVLGTGSRRLRRPHRDAAVGVSQVQYLIRDAHFAGGQYFVNVEVADENGSSLDIEWQIVDFFVPMEHRQTGTVYADIELV